VSKIAYAFIGFRCSDRAEGATGELKLIVILTMTSCLEGKRSICANVAHAIDFPPGRRKKKEPRRKFLLGS